MHWAGAGWRDCPSLRGEAAYQHRSPLAGLSRTIGGPRRTGTGWLRCKEITPLPAPTPTPGTLSCRPGSSAPTTHQLGAHPPATEDLWSHPPQKTAGPADQGGGRGPLVARWGVECAFSESFSAGGCPTYPISELYDCALRKGRDVACLCLSWDSFERGLSQTGRHYASGGAALGKARGLLRKRN